MEEKIQAVAKLKAIKTYIETLQEEYEKLQDEDIFNDLRVNQTEEIIIKEKILREIKDFVNNL